MPEDTSEYSEPDEASERRASCGTDDDDAAPSRSPPSPQGAGSLSAPQPLALSAAASNALVPSRCSLRNRCATEAMFGSLSLVLNHWAKPSNQGASPFDRGVCRCRVETFDADLPWSSVMRSGRTEGLKTEATAGAGLAVGLAAAR